MESDAKPATLSLIKDNKIIEIIEINKSNYVLGRENCDLNLEDDEASFSHCQIQFIQGNYHIFDLNSTNGTFLNTDRIVKAKLTNNDTIRVGQTEFLFNDSTNKVEIGSKLNTEVCFDSRLLPEPNNPIWKQIDDLLEAEKDYFIKNYPVGVEVTYPDNSTETITFTDELIIGRLSTQGRFNKDDEISRKHAKIFKDAKGNCLIEDLDSTNGVQVNRQRIKKPQLLHNDDAIVIGKTKLKVILDKYLSYTLS